MNLGRLFAFLFLVFSVTATATTFIENSIEDRMRTATGVIKVEYLGEAYKKLPDGQVVTEATVRILENSGVKSSDIINHNNFKILLPGGLWQGRRYKVSGVPRFQPGEISYLVIQKSDFGFILPNLAMSKFDIKSEDSEKFLVSSIFSNKMGIGKIKEKDFNLLVEETFGKKLTKINIDKYVGRIEEEGSQRGNRNPASTKKEEPEDEPIPTLWLVLVLGFLGFIPAFLLRGKRNEG